MTTVQKHIEFLQRNFKQGDVIAVATWTVADVLEQAKTKKMNITKAQAEKVLERIDRKQSADLGITWDTIDCYLDLSLIHI